MEFGEVFKLVAHGPYCDFHFIDNSHKTETKTLKKVLEINPDVFLRINRKIAIRISFIKEISESAVILQNKEIYYFSRRRKPILK